MQDTELLQEGLALMGLGMGFVFVFLTVLVGITTLMSRVIGRCFPEPAKVPAATPSRAPKAKPDDSDLAVVISAAVHRYRQRHRR